ncbi:MAG: hypothetical protein M0Z68_11180, partial [Gammaproteobacteria bacterium]|nr:hypothetical protein [Gammaproteobacteria bacterium]
MSHEWPTVWPAPAKINLFLHVVGRRPDGGSLALHWVVGPAAYQMTGYGPFGRLIFRLRVDAAGARLRTG